MVRLLILSIALFLLVGCTSNMEHVRLAFQAGDYHTVSVKIIDELNRSPVSNDVLEFLNEYGEIFILKGYKKGQFLLTKQQYIECMDLTSAYMFVLESFDQKGYFPELVPLHLDFAMDLFKQAKSEFITFKYELASRDFNQKRYRSSYFHLLDLHAHTRGYKESLVLEERAFANAQRHVSISPFIKLADPISIFLNKSLSQVFGGHFHDNIELNGIPLIIDGIDITAKFNQTMMELLQQKKSQFLTITFDTIREDISGSTYYVEGILDAEVDDFSNQPIEETRSDVLLFRYSTSEPWQEFPFDYTVQKVQYGLNLIVKADIYMTHNDEKVSSLYFNKRFDDSFLIRGEPITFPSGSPIVQFPSNYLQYPQTIRKMNAAYVIDQTILNAAGELVSKIIETIDNDLDPYSLDHSEARSML